MSGIRHSECNFSTGLTLSLPLLSSSTYDNTGKVYNITRVIDAAGNLDIGELCLMELIVG